jgi:hypothetical protein
MKRIILFLIITTTCISVSAQNFDSQSKLKDCEINMEISGKKKHVKKDMAFVESMKGVELVWIIVDSSKGWKTSKARKVFVETQIKDGKTVICLMPKNRITQYGTTVTGIYPNWKYMKNFRFYRADCYSSIMEE